VQRDTPSDSNLALELHLHTLMDEYLLQEESLWRTKSRELWLTSVDLNTKFFHTSTLIRCRRNSIDILQSPNFGWLTESRDIGACFINNFKNLFTTSNHALPTEFMDSLTVLFLKMIILSYVLNLQILKFIKQLLSRVVLYKIIQFWLMRCFIPLNTSAEEEVS
jgi:hypothetical protein